MLEGELGNFGSVERDDPLFAPCPSLNSLDALELKLLNDGSQGVSELSFIHHPIYPGSKSHS